MRQPPPRRGSSRSDVMSRASCFFSAGFHRSKVRECVCSSLRSGADTTRVCARTHTVTCESAILFTRRMMSMAADDSQHAAPSQAQLRLNGFILLLASSLFQDVIEDYGETDGEYDHEPIVTLLVMVALLSARFALPVVCSYALCVISWKGSRFPGTSNHANLQLFIHASLLVAATPHSLHTQRAAYDSILRASSSTCEGALAIAYIWAGWHKMNYDFFSTRHGCALNFINRWSRRLLKLPPIGTVDADGPLWPLIMAAGLGAILLECGAGVLQLQSGAGARSLGVACALMLHVPLSLISFFDFSSVALAVFYLSSRPVVLQPFTVRDWSCPVDRRAAIHVLGLSTASCLVRPLLSVLAPNRRQEAKEVELCLGVAFLLGATYLALPSLSGGGVIRGFRWPRRVWQWSMLLSVVLFGASPYLGLSTAGCFTMFSNIATQGESSNHLLLGQNPFKMFRFQDDIVTVVSISPRLDGSWGLLPHRGQRFPRVLFSQWLDEVVSVRAHEEPWFHLVVRHGAQEHDLSYGAGPWREPFLRVRTRDAWWPTNWLSFRESDVVYGVGQRCSQ